MKLSILIIALGSLTACSTLPTEHRLGSVAKVSGHELQLCFEPQITPPLAGQQIQLVRREQIGNPKFAPTFRERTVGTAQITAEASGRCVAATLIQGKARRYDEVHPSRRTSTTLTIVTGSQLRRQADCTATAPALQSPTTQRS